MCSPTWKSRIPSYMCSPIWETHIPSDMCSPTWETHIPSGMCSPTWETHFPSDRRFPCGETHIPSVLCSPTRETRFPFNMCSPTCIPRELTRGFRPKLAIFLPLFFLGNIGKENFFCDVLERKNAFLGYKNKKLKESKNCHFSKGVNPMFWPNNGHFSNFFLLGKIDQENVFYDILERKNALLGYKKKKLKRSKIDIFSKGLTHRFVPKMAIFSTSFFLGNISQENVFYDILERKHAFLGYKNKTFKKSKS